MKKKKILLFSDDLRMSSGVGTMSREMIVGTAHHFDWVQVGGAVKHPDEGKNFDLSKDINEERGIDNASVKILNELYKKFKKEGSDITLQKLVNRSMDLYLKDKKYKKLITEHEELIQSGSSL